MIRKWLGMGALAASLVATTADARVVSLEIQKREPVLNGKAFGGAGAYEKLVGKVHFALDPKSVRVLALQSNTNMSSAIAGVSSGDTTAVPRISR